MLPTQSEKEPKDSSFTSLDSFSNLVANNFLILVATQVSLG